MYRYHQWQWTKKEKPMFQYRVLLTHDKSLLLVPSFWITDLIYPCSWSTKVKATKFYQMLAFQKSFLNFFSEKSPENQKALMTYFVVKLPTKSLKFWKTIISWYPNFHQAWNIYFQCLTFLPTRLQQKFLWSRNFLIGSRDKSASG